MNTKLAFAVPAVLAVCLAALGGCASIVGIGTLTDDGGSGGSSGGGSSGGSSSGTSGSSGGSSSGGTSSGGPSAFAGTWTVSGEGTGSCLTSPETLSGPQTLTTGPGANQISTTAEPTCDLTLTFTVSGNNATLDPGLSCTTTNSEDEPILVQWTSGSITLSSTTSIAVALSTTLTDEDTGGTCSINESITATK